jgi:parallel beta-helix repeat protein
MAQPYSSPRTGPKGAVCLSLNSMGAISTEQPEEKPAMKTTMQALAGVVITICFAVTTARGQGSLTPPGAPSPTMKTLSQVEPRLAITNLPVAITVPGSYYLTGDLLGPSDSDGITINVNDVTIDLNGFRLVGAAGSLRGIAVNGVHTGISIRGGSVRNWGQVGINAFSAYGTHLSDLTVANCASNGLLTGEGSIVRGCTLRDNGGAGMRTGANSRVLDCTSAGNDGIGIMAHFGCLIANCASAANYEGINAAAASTVKDCTVRNNNFDGIKVSGGCVVTANLSENNGRNGSGAGIHVTDNANRIEGNHILGSDRGLDVDGTRNYVADNTVTGNTNNYDFAQDNHLSLLLCEIPETLEWPCSVTFAGTLTTAETGADGITVAASDITIDMAGHALVGPGGNSGYGIYQSDAYRNLRIANGKVVSWRGQGKAGVYGSGYSVILTDLQALTNSMGLRATHGGILSRCTASENSVQGLSAGFGCVLVDCVAYDNAGIGIGVGSGCTISDSTARQNGRDGIWVDGSGNQVLKCVCTRNGTVTVGSAGILVEGSDNRIEGNNVTDNDRGIDVDGTGNFVARNTASGNDTNWTVVAGNVCLVIQATNTTTSFDGDSGGAAPGSADPNANFTY